MKQPEIIKEDNSYRVEYFCPICDAWIATKYFANDDTYIYGIESSDSNGIGEPCRCCKGSAMKNNDILTQIESALGIELYEWQKEYILNDGDIPSGRGNGKTLAYDIRLLLNEDIKIIKSFDFILLDEYTFHNSFNKSALGPYLMWHFKQLKELYDKLIGSNVPIPSKEFISRR